MQLLVIDRDMVRLERAVMVGLGQGFFATGTGSLRVAEEVLTRMPVDLLMAEAETMEDALGDLLGLAEERNEGLRSVLLSQSVARHHDELADAFGSLVAVLDSSIDPAVALKMALPRASALRVRAAPLMLRPDDQLWRSQRSTTLEVAA
ncbi:MAG: hypothetical protein AAFY38_09990 [Pseudomonadota bacterium]